MDEPLYPPIHPLIPVLKHNILGWVYVNPGERFVPMKNCQCSASYNQHCPVVAHALRAPLEPIKHETLSRITGRFIKKPQF